MNYRPKFGTHVSVWPSRQLVSKRSVPAEFVQILTCVRSVVFHKHESPFSSITGTGFLVELLGNVYFVTAKHVVKNFDRQDLHVSYSSTDRAYVYWERVLECQPQDPDDTDYADLVVYLMDRKKLERERFGAERPIDLTEGNFVTDFSPSLRLCFAGMSAEASVHDYEGENFIAVFQSAEATYDRPDSARDVHVMRLVSKANALDIDGHSGGPVFHIASDGKTLRPYLAGMMISGTSSSGIIRFISAERIYQCLVAMGHEFGFAEIMNLEPL